MRKLIIAFLSVASLSAVAGPVMPTSDVPSTQFDRTIAGSYTQIPYVSRVEVVEKDGEQIQQYHQELLSVGTAVGVVAGQCIIETRTLVRWEQDANGIKRPIVKVQKQTMPCPNSWQ